MADESKLGDLRREPSVQPAVPTGHTSVPRPPVRWKTRVLLPGAIVLAEARLELERFPSQITVQRARLAELQTELAAKARAALQAAQAARAQAFARLVSRYPVPKSVDDNNRFGGS